jgi:hypothetical protein
MSTLTVKRWRHARDYYRPWNDLYARLIAYCLDLEHYKRNYKFDNDVRRLQPKGQRLFNLVRHKLSLLTTDPITFEVNPIQANADAYGAHLAKMVLRATLLDPALRYARNRRSMVMSALAGARGCMAAEYDPDVPGGTCIRIVDPRRLTVTPGVLDFHDARAPYCIEEVPMHIADVRSKAHSAGWKVPKNLVPDGWKSDYAQGHQQDLSAPVFSGLTSEMVPGVDEAMESDGIVTVLKMYSRHDPFASTEDRAKRFDLPREEWHWLDDETGDKVPLPPTQDPLATPPPLSAATGQPLRLVTTLDGTEEHYLYPEGVCNIAFPFYGGDEAAGWCGDWLPGKVNQDVRMTHFPYMHLTSYHHPLRLIGKSDTELLHSLQSIDDMSTRQGWEQLRAAQALIISTRGGLEGADPGQAFEWTDRPIEFAYASDRLAAESVKFMQMQGMNPSLVPFKEIIDREWAQIGSGDIAMPDDRSRDVAVGTIQALQQQGDLPVRMHAEDLRAEESIFFRVILDQKRAYMSVPQLVQWVNEDMGMLDPMTGLPVPVGAPMAAEVTGDMLAASNIVVTAQSDWRAMDIDKVQAISQFMGQVPPQMWGVMAPEAGFSPTAVAAMKNMAASMTMQPTGQGGPPNPSADKGGKPDGPAGQGALPTK